MSLLMKCKVGHQDLGVILKSLGEVKLDLYIHDTAYTETIGTD